MSNHNSGMTRLTLISLCFIANFVSSAHAEVYKARVGDTIIVTVREREWFSGERVIDENGQITLAEPIGVVKVFGLTQGEITELLTEKLRKTIIEPTVFVMISKASRLTVHITGEVQAPNTFEVTEGTSLQAAITRAGGFTTNADKKRIKIVRKNTEQIDAVSELMIDFTQFGENALQSANPVLKDEDTVVVPRLPKSERQVILVIGAVNQPGAYPYEEPISLIEVLLRAGGPSSNADLKQISILRSEGDKYPLKQINLENFLAGVGPSADLTLSKGEVVFVPNKKPSRETVNVIGAITKPSSYPIYQESRLLDAIYDAGGFTTSAAVDKVTIIRPSNPHPQRIVVNVANYLKTGDLKYNPLLQAGDTVFTPIREDIQKSVSGVQAAFIESIHVTIIGEIKIPGTYQISKESTVLDVLNLAGGPTPQAGLDRVAIIRENIQIQIDVESMLEDGKLRSFPPLQASDTIRIPKITRKVSTLRSILLITRDAASIISIFLLISSRL